MSVDSFLVFIKILPSHLCFIVCIGLLQKTKGSTVCPSVLCQIHKVPNDYKAEHFRRQIAINLCSQSKEISKMQNIKDKLKYHGYNYGVYCQEMAQENGIIPHIDLSAADVQLFLNIPILVIQTSYTHNPTSNKKEWFCTAHEALGTTIDLDIHKIIIVDNNDGFVGATAPIPITHLKEDMISMVDNLKYTIESVQTVLESVPKGTQFYKSTTRVLNYLTAAQQLSSSTNTTIGTAGIALIDTSALVPPMHSGIPSKKRKRAVSTVTSDQVDADTPVATQMDPEVKFADQVPSPVVSCKLHILADLKSVAISYF